MVPSYQLERLCAHHDIASFECGDDLYDEGLRVNGQSLGDPLHDTVVFVALDGSRVDGYISFARIPPDTFPELSEPAIAIPAVAVDLNCPAPTKCYRVLRELVNRVRDDEIHSIGVLVAMPTTDQMARFLRGVGFVPIRPDSAFWKLVL